MYFSYAELALNLYHNSYHCTTNFLIQYQN